MKQEKKPVVVPAAVAPVPAVSPPQTTNTIVIVPAAPEEGMSVGGMVLRGLAVVSMGLCAYHGYKRNDSIGWGVAWGALGSAFPIITVAIAAAQGFGERASA